MARPLSVHSELGNRYTCTSVSPFRTARWIIVEASWIFSSSDLPDGRLSRSIGDWLARGVRSHFARVRRVVAADAVDAPHREALGRPDHGNGRAGDRERRLCARGGRAGRRASGDGAGHHRAGGLQQVTSGDLGHGVPPSAFQHSRGALPVGAGWMLSTQCTFSGLGSTFGRSRFTTTGCWPLRQSTQDSGSASLALISWWGT